MFVHVNIVKLFVLLICCVICQNSFAGQTLFISEISLGVQSALPDH